MTRAVTCWTNSRIAFSSQAPSESEHLAAAPCGGIQVGSESQHAACSWTQLCELHPDVQRSLQAQKEARII